MAKCVHRVVILIGKIISIRAFKPRALIRVHPHGVPDILICIIHTRIDNRNNRLRFRRNLHAGKANPAAGCLHGSGPVQIPLVSRQGVISDIAKMCIAVRRNRIHIELFGDDFHQFFRRIGIGADKRHIIPDAL